MADPREPYVVEDQYNDPIPPSDAWGKFLSMRYSHRPAFYGSLNTSEKELIKKEVQRIRHFREYVNEKSSPDRTRLSSFLKQSHSLWRKMAVQNCKEELADCEAKMAESADLSRYERYRRILREVQVWETEKYSTFQESLFPETYILNLDAPAEDNPNDRDYGYNGWMVVFQKGTGGVTLDHPHCHGQFPNQKISIQQLLHNKLETPFKQRENKEEFRYFHLPANNMKWVEEAISRYYEEDLPEFDAHTIVTNRSNAEQLLKHELWRGQQRGGIGSPVHSRHIGSRCSLVPSASSKSKGMDIALFMPYLHWEVEQRLLRMSEVVKKTTKVEEQKSTFKRNRTHEFAKAASNWKIELGLHAIAKKSKERSWKPQSPLAAYLWHAAKLFEIIDEAADERHIAEHLYASPPLHMRRTLDQYYYPTIDDTVSRDQDQVVCRGTRTRNEPGGTARVVMVDQLWLWILDDNTILTSFPRRWGRNKPDPSATHRGIRDHLGKLDADEINSIYDLALVIVDECSKIFFDRTKPLDQRPEVVDIFGSAISNIAEMKTMTYERFGRDINTINAHDSLESVEKLVRKSLNISFEWSVLIEAQHVIDELQIMQEIFTQQMTVMKDFVNALRTMTAKSVGPRGTILASTSERAIALIADMETRREELANLERLQAKTRVQLRELLDMKQQQSGIIEAKAALKRADEAVLQGRSVMVFTVVTIFFLPLSFFATVFGMNAKEINDSTLSLSSELKYMFGLSSLVIIIALAFGFSTWARTVFVLTFRLPLAYLVDWMNLHNVTGKHFFSTSALRNLERTKVHELQRRNVVKQLKQIKDSGRGSSLELQGVKGSFGLTSRDVLKQRRRGFWNRKIRRDPESG